SPGDFGFAGLDTSLADGAVTILADTMSLSAGTIDAGFGAVILGPATLNRNIVLGAAGTATTLGLTQADLDTIVTGSLQIGYRNVDGSVSFTGTIDIASPITIDPNPIPTLLLVTGGSVTESGGGISTVANSPFPLELGIIAGGAVTMTQDNSVDVLA